MRTSRIRAKLAANKPALVTTLHLTDPSLFELTSLMGFDGIWMDMEHHAYSLETAAGLMRAARVGSSDIVARPAKGEFMRMARMLEAGAHGIMYPRCDDANEAAEVVRWAKFAPLGERGCDGANGDAPYCSMPLDQYVHQANQQTFLVVQLEQAHAIDQAEAIAAVEGVDVLMLGPGDLSVLSNVPGQIDHPLIQEAMERVAVAARNTGKHWGTSCSNLQTIAETLEMGARFLCYGGDILMIKQGLEKIQQDCARLGFTFDNQLSFPNLKDEEHA
ncbi:MAG: aldolase/citrate lyase family protein [Pirellulales bacterium]|nr:aldolase/citrate lyase family protein [Pirellulales bacterium]